MTWARGSVGAALVLLGCATERGERVGSVFIADASGDASPEVPGQVACGSFSQVLACPPYAGDGDAASRCPSPELAFSSPTGFAIGCWVMANDQAQVFDGGCFSPTYTCVAEPTPHWEVSWSP